MGVNRAGMAIVDEKAAAEAAKQEIIRRFFRYSCEYAMGLADEETIRRVRVLMEELHLAPEQRAVVQPAYDALGAAEQHEAKGHRGIFCGAALALPNGEIVTGRNSPLMHAASSLVLNSVKHLAGIPVHLDLISPNVIESIASRPERQLDHQPYGPHGDGAAPQAPRLRGPHHPPALTGRRAGAAPHRGQPHLRPPLCHA
jgi:uncharacterized protein (UPF0371 family)